MNNMVEIGTMMITIMIMTVMEGVGEEDVHVINTHSTHSIHSTRSFRSTHRTTANHTTVHMATNLNPSTNSPKCFSE